MTRQFLLLILLPLNIYCQVKITVIDPSTVLPQNFYSLDTSIFKKNVDYLFSPTGDTLSCPSGAKCYIVRLQNDSMHDLDSFDIAPDKRLTVDDYPAELLKKYHLKYKGTLVNPDSVNNLVVNFKILSNKKISKSFWSPELGLNFYRLDLSVSIIFCNHVILKNYKFIVDYEFNEKRSDFKFHKSEIIDNLIKVDNKDQYYFKVNIVESYFNISDKTKQARTVYFRPHLINCH